MLDISAPDAFCRRYPELAFLTNMLSFPKKKIKDHIALSETGHIEDAEVIYIYGLGSGKAFSYFLPWLNRQKDRDLVIIEDDLAALHVFMNNASGKTFVEHPQFHIRFCLDKGRLEDFCDECAFSFPLSRIAIFNNKGRKKERDFEQIKLQILRKTTIREALAKETLYYHELFKNLYPNFQLWPESFFANALQRQFPNTPAIICGAGPSLEESAPDLKKMQNKALILAGGSTISALSRMGIFPHLGFAIDPNPEEYYCLKPSTIFDEVPLLYGGRLQNRVSLLHNSPLGYLKTSTGGNAEAWLEKQVGFSQKALDHGNHAEALSVTTSAIAFAVMLGCNPIYFCGVDLAYTGLKRYSAGVKEDSTVRLEKLKKDLRAGETFIEKINPYGKKVYTLVKWIMESAWISHFTKQHPEINFYNASKAGLGFEGVPYRSLRPLFAAPSRDYKGEIFAKTQEVKLAVSKQDINAHLKTLSASLKKSYGLCLNILEEIEKEKDCDNSVHFTLYKMDLEEEEAFRILFDGLEETLTAYYQRKFRCHPFMAEKEKRLQQYRVKQNVWQHLKKIMQDYLETFEKNTSQS
ncbi:MAG: motility associated factor glycosyltransferase family protein [Simkaniaceae bacterium]